MDGVRIGSATCLQYSDDEAPMFSAASRHSFFQAVDGRRDDQDHQRDLEVQVDEPVAELVRELEAHVS